MQNSTKKLLSMVLTLALLLGVIPFAPRVSAATADTEAASDMLANATYDYSVQNWNGGEFSYDSASAVTNGADSLRSWKFSVKEKTGISYGRLRLALNDSYDMTNQDLLFDVKADPAKELTGYTLGIVPYNANKEAIHDMTNYKEYEAYFTGDGWHTITISNSILKAFLLEGKDLKDVSYLHLSFTFPGGAAQNIYIDNMRLSPCNVVTDSQDAESDLLANATVVENGADNTAYFYDHESEVAYGDSSNKSHKYSASSGAATLFTVKYDLGKSYDLTHKNVVLDMLSYRAGNGFAFALYNSQNQQVSYSECYTTANQWGKVRPDIIGDVKSGKNLSDVRYIAISPRFATNTSRADRAFYLDNLQIETIDVHYTALQNKNIVFMGDSITASYGFKGWSGELEEHYLINKYNIGVGGASFATLSGRTTIYAQTANIPNADVDFFVLNGGVNDIWSKADLGAVSSISVANATVNSFDTNTTAGAMEQVFCYLRQNHADAKLAFIINYICYSTEIDGVRFRDEFAPLAKEICEKWGVTWIDLTDNTEINALYGVHTYDGVHGNDIAYELVMRELAPVLIGMCDANEQTEQNSDLLSYATYSWSAQQWNAGGSLSYDSSSTVVSGKGSTRSWKFSATAGQTANAGIQLALNNLDIFYLTGRAISFDVKFENAAQKIGLRLYDKNWKCITDSAVWAEGNGSTGWQTITVDASEFEAVLANGYSLDDIRMVYFEFDFTANAGKSQNVYIDNFRVVNVDATDATEKASDLLCGAGFVEGSVQSEGYGYDLQNTTFLKGQDSKYSLRFYAEDDKDGWITATYILPESIDLTESSLQFDVNQYNQVALWVDLYDSNYKKVTGDSYTLREIGWQTYEVNALYGLAEGRTAEALSDIRYIRFSFNFSPANTGRTVVIDNLTTYHNEQRSSMAAGLNGLYLGDSISEAHNYKGWHGEMAEHYGVTGYNVAVGGRTLANDGIYSELANVPANMKFDFVMLNGVVNDYFASVATGTLTPEGTTTFDSTTAIGGLEKLFCEITSRYPDAEVFYILNFVPNWSSFRKTEYLNDFIPLAKQACEKWGVHLLDLVDNPQFLAEFDVTADVHTFDGLHPNKAGFDVITPYVVSMLEETMCSDANVRYQQLSLGDDLSMRFDIAVSGAYANTAAVTVTVDGNAVMENVSYVSLAAGVTGCKKFTLDMAAAQMSDEIVITISDGDVVLVEKCYSVRDYILALLEGNYDAKLKELAKATLNYGAGAQVYFDHNTDTLTNAGYESTDAAAIPEINTENMISGEVPGIYYYGASLVYSSKIAVRYYFVVSGNINDYTFSSGNAPVLKDGKYYVEIPGINPQEYDQEIALTVSDGAQEMTVTYSPLYYIGRMYNKTDKQSLKTLLATMYQYHIAALDYVTQEVIRGDGFEAGESVTEIVTGDNYTTVSFDYKLTNEGKISVFLRGADAWLNSYGNYDFTADGASKAYAGVTTEKLSDGYIRVTMNVEKLDVIFNGEPNGICALEIFGSWSTAGGYIDNIQFSFDSPEPEEPEDIHEFTAGAGTTLVFENAAYTTVSFDYKLTSEGTMTLILRDADNWTSKVYGDYTFNATGLAYNYGSYQSGITCEALDNGYIRVTMVLAELQRSMLADDRNGAPVNVGVFDIYSWTSANGCVANVKFSMGEIEEPEEPTEPEITEPEEIHEFTAGKGITLMYDNAAYTTVSFDYKLASEGTMCLILRDADNWTSKVYGDYTFNATGLAYNYGNYQSGITCEALDNGYVRVTMVLAELQRSMLADNRNGAPVNVGVFDIYSWTNVNGCVASVKFSMGDEEEPEAPTEPVIRGEAFTAGTGITKQFEGGNYSSLSFEYKLTGEGDIHVFLRGADVWLNSYGNFKFNADGAVGSYAGVTTEKLADGYIRVTFEIDALTTIYNSEPNGIRALEIFGGWTTADGYMDNIVF